MPAAVEICTWCGRKYEVKQRKRGGARGSFCSERCKLAHHYDYDRKTGWYLMQMVGKLVKGKPLPKFRPRPYPGVAEYRLEWNRAATTLRELSDQ